jgi:HAD superfamily hydrolase (TIGR01549 family)
MAKKRKLKCIIFDMDGTLTKTNQLIFDSFNHIAAKYEGRSYTDEEITAMFGPPEEGALAEIVGEEKLERAMQEYLKYYRAHHKDLAQLYPGILDVLKYLKRRGIHLAVFTGKGICTTTITMQAFGLMPYFEFVVTGNDVENYKPSAEGILKIIKHFSVRKGDVLMVGDSVGDVKASLEAGIRIAAVLWDSHAKKKVLRMRTDFVFHNVDEFFVWLRRQFD